MFRKSPNLLARSAAIAAILLFSFAPVVAANAAADKAESEAKAREYFSNVELVDQDGGPVPTTGEPRHGAVWVRATRTPAGPVLSLLNFAILTGANFSSAMMRKADLTGGVNAQGTNFLLASMQGADLTGAQLQYADFTSAGLQGAGLNYGNFHAAVLRNADMEGADLQQAKLFGAELAGAKLQGADMRYAEVWDTTPPNSESMTLADLTNLQLKPPTDAERTGLNAILGRIRNDDTRRLVSAGLAPLLDPKVSARWASSEDLGRWRAMQEQSAAGAADMTFSAQLTAYLAQVMCRPRWVLGSVATGIARRAQSELFRGDMRMIHQQLVNGACPAGKSVSARVMQDLTAAIDLMRPAN